MGSSKFVKKASTVGVLFVLRKGYCLIMKCLILLVCLAFAKGGMAEKVEMTAEEKAKLMNEMMEADIQKEIEEMIDTLSAEELDQLEAILGKPLDEKTELQMIQAELQQLGMDPQDGQDMFDLSEMMKKFLLKIPDVDTKLQLASDDYSLEDHCKLYLLGLPNKLGPLGFLALHSILESAGEAIVDVELGSFVADDQVQGPTDVTPLGDLFSRKRRQLEAMAAKAAAADEARSEEAAEGSEEDVDDDIVASILKRRRRSVSDKAYKN